MVEDRDRRSLADLLQEKIKVLHDSIWERHADWPHVSAWLKQFKDEETTDDDQLHALYMLSNFMYFGTSEIRALLKSLYRDVFRASVIAEIRLRRCTWRGGGAGVDYRFIFRHAERQTHRKAQHHQQLKAFFEPHPNCR